MFHSNVIDQTIKKLRSQTANLLTLLNLGLGGFATLVAINGQLNLSVILIFIAALADRFDGLIARKLNIESDLGKQLDSMSDIVSFGVAPAILLYQGVLHSFGYPGLFFTVFYIGCGAFRLARFNITESNGFFTGLPITAAGCLATLSYLALPILPSHLYLFIILILALFMIASFRLKKF
ncbi:CDP-diacylglycerol--serine O-phosphatidyltransferase [Heyndrickxia sporothermodurans]|uniref:CDP-diacylglycerol--serine O-phosphatidyltransferase n=2 Tax=Heyndrickxia sporothermodurans TaxID=46224 RepID=A0A150LF34_9BACI|nr:CDP-diacylglycerol--serine O-phosphatidyltransferase [Heyndrickxia sporothermodurans]KYD10948.1 CDP-diacylglycerol--serine O-phosphatidyltransferase [Heyndrickxia sporothermodurans]MBL5768151.1 CDP-diacylglycerol--serine O-phosphatidyltransferase [Heyndrickxia sporothermodurans]MBL5771804.1 CDP-diacylglycerol--serine O-phosphatidyltransferase [Heyndrickxia sporothermodurans]MBL5775433.1 CDP-diacylglycerol--serine O-phosphatidyltransferase [Heyndrickxia sporothermodurans]MBL5779002.1 CDP-dia